MELDTKHFLDHEGGVNQFEQDILLEDGEFVDSRNIYTEGGALYSRNGFRKIGQAFGENIETLFPYKNSDGASYILAVGASGACKRMLMPPNKLFTVTQGAAGAVFTSGATYKYAITYVDTDGVESPLSKIIDVTPTAGSATIELTNIPVGSPNVWYKKIYRS